MNVTSPVTNDAVSISVAIAPAPRPTRRPSSRRNTAPARGNARISQEVETAEGIRRSPLHALRLVDGGARLAAEERHDDREPDDDLGRGDDDHEEREDLTVQVPVHPRERDEREVHGVQHQLDRQEDHDRIATHEHSDHTGGEEHRREREVLRRLDHTRSSLRASGEPASSFRSAMWDAASSSSRRRPSTIAPIAAMRSRIEATSNGNMYLVNSTRPTASVLPDALARERPWNVLPPSVEWIVKIATPANPAPSTSAAGRWNRMGSSSNSLR